MAAAASPCSNWGANGRILSTGLRLRLLWSLDSCSPSDCASSSSGWTEEGLKKLKVVDELPVGGFGNRFVSFTYLKTLRIHCSPCVLELFTSLLSLSDRAMVLTIMIALMDSDVAERQCKVIDH